MSKIRKILRMFSNGRSIMSISAQVDASRNTVKKYLASFKESGFTFEEVDALSDQSFSLSSKWPRPMVLISKRLLESNGSSC
ncbi:helix-turn-helix domain-containing protein [Pedobacter gandavensis]|uniref:helix-turn-helix domain-containing protein n=1 Tax=Pedobacter gandavensis TaxID=2679963 RepID=UPI00292D7BCF|nr:helix-turn-helix domain-containing protein [Pedobacter gandavensis]